MRPHQKRWAMREVLPGSRSTLVGVIGRIRRAHSIFELRIGTVLGIKRLRIRLHGKRAPTYYDGGVPFHLAHLFIDGGCGYVP